MTIQVALQDEYIKGELKGKIEGKVEGKMDTLLSLVRDGLLNKNEAAKRAEMSLEEFDKVLVEFNS